MDAVVNLPPLRTVEYGFVFFSDALTNKFGNYVIQRAFEKSNQAQRYRILVNIKYTIMNMPNSLKSPMRHVLK
jgi:hypothetical protein